MKDKINTIILENVIKSEEFEGRKILYIKEEGFNFLWDLRQNEINRLIEEGDKKTFAKKKALADYFKIINPQKTPIKVLSYSLMASYTLVKDKTKILEKYIDAEFANWEKSTWINAKKKMKEMNDEVEIHKFELMVKDNIERTRQIYEDIKNNPDKYNVLYTKFERISKEKLYQPIVNFAYFDNRIKYSHEYLRKEVPNLIYEDIIKYPKNKKSSEIEKRLSQMRNIFGSIYIKEEK